MKVTIFGPNLRVQSKGTFHVHAADCGDCSKYGPGTRYGGDDRGWTVEAASQFEVSQDVYADHAGDDYESGSPEWVKYLEDAVSDFYFAPCVKLPFREAVDGMTARARLDKAAAEYRRTYDRLYLRSMAAGSAEECDRIDAALAAANAKYDAAKAAYEGGK